MNTTIFVLAKSTEKFVAPVASWMPLSLDRLQAAAWVYTLAEPSAFIKRLL